ncbi:hypothetical protein T01_7514 [Trichinella spiralis]|uniref:Uncharacterized protein n=1 Tax=Trichinella spiralis TaxID=6334 RepID=A0A0V1BXN9_TRISP|nr:hypothetical protein T01_7514 [Trichinella spiralis]
MNLDFPFTYNFKIINVKIASCLHWVDDNWMRTKKRSVVLVVVSIRDNVKEFLAPRRVGVYQQSKATFPLPSSWQTKLRMILNWIP